MFGNPFHNSMFEEFTDPETGETYQVTSGTGRHTTFKSSDGTTFDTRPRHRFTKADMVAHHRRMHDMEDFFL